MVAPGFQSFFRPLCIIAAVGLSAAIILVAGSCQNRSNEVSDDALWEMAREICENNIILDAHIDWPEWIIDFPEDISMETKAGDFDFVRARKGGLDAVLSVVYISPDYGIKEGRIMVDSQINLVTNYTIIHPDKFARATIPAEIERNSRKKLISVPLCLENGSPIGHDLEYLQFLKNEGIAYITLTHAKANQISDSSYDPDRPWNGLSPFGLEVIKEMNRLGIMIDISHSTDSAAFQSISHSKAPVIATHSSCRHFTPGFERNVSDTLIKAIAAGNGVVMLNFGSSFLDPICLKNWDYLLEWYDSTGIDEFSKEGIAFTLKYGESHNLYSNSRQLVDHIDHMVKLVGVDYVGIGSDYDGIGYSQPSDLPDVSSYPVIVFELLKRGYLEDDIQKILSTNFLRVWNEVIEVAKGSSKIPLEEL